jgi:hypothetical protein
LVKHNKYKYSEACRLNVFKQDVIEVLLCWLLLSAKNNQLFVVWWFLVLQHILLSAA